MTRDQVKAAADALARLEALEAALKAAGRAPHESLPISFVSVDGADDDAKCGVIAEEREEFRSERYPIISDHGIKAFYPRSSYIKNVAFLIANERAFLEERGVKL